MRILAILLFAPLLILAQEKNCNWIPRRTIPCLPILISEINDTSYAYLPDGCDIAKYNSNANGFWKVFLGDTSTLFEIASFLNGQRNGIATIYFRNGLINSQAEYKEGKLDRKYIEYFESGQIKSQAEYKEGKLYGKFIEYHESGLIKGKGTYRIDKSGRELYTGYWSEYWNNGKIAHLFNQKDNSYFDPNEKWWDQDGNPISKEQFKKLWFCN